VGGAGRSSCSAGKEVGPCWGRTAILSLCLAGQAASCARWCCNIKPTASGAQHTPQDHARQHLAAALQLPTAALTRPPMPLSPASPSRST
jgi:hypothetical protein